MGQGTSMLSCSMCSLPHVRSLAAAVLLLARSGFNRRRLACASSAADEACDYVNANK